MPIGLCNLEAGELPISCNALPTTLLGYVRRIIYDLETTVRRFCGKLFTVGGGDRTDPIERLDDCSRRVRASSSPAHSIQSLCRLPVLSVVGSGVDDDM